MGMEYSQVRLNHQGCITSSIPFFIPTQMQLPTTFKIRATDGQTKIYDSFIPTGSGCYEAIAVMEKQIDAKDFTPVYGWSDMPYRDVSVSDKHLAILTFCEGDVTLEVAPDVEAYRKAILEAHDFYVVKYDNYLWGGHSSIEGEQPIAKAAIATMPDDWRQFRLQKRFHASCQEDVLGVSWDLGALYRLAADYLEANPYDCLCLINAGGGDGGSSFGSKSIDSAFGEAAKKFNPITRRMSWQKE